MGKKVGGNLCDLLEMGAQRQESLQVVCGRAVCKTKGTGDFSFLLGRVVVMFMKLLR